MYTLLDKFMIIWVIMCVCVCVCVCVYIMYVHCVQPYHKERPQGLNGMACTTPTTCSFPGVHAANSLHTITHVCVCVYVLCTYLYLVEAWPLLRSHAMICEAEKVFGNVLNLHNVHTFRDYHHTMVHHTMVHHIIVRGTHSTMNITHVFCQYLHTFTHMYKAKLFNFFCKVHLLHTGHTCVNFKANHIGQCYF